MIKEMPEGPEKAKALVKYRKMMGKLYVTLCEVEEAFLNGKIDEVAKIVESLKEHEKRPATTSSWRKRRSDRFTVIST